MSRWREKAAWPWHYASLAARSLLAGSARPEPVRPQPVRRLLVLGYAAVGDFVFLLPALRALRSGLPRARVTFAANRSPISEELLPACGLADEIWTCESEELSRGRGRRRFERRIAAAGFDAVVASQATPMRGFARAVLGVPIRIGHCRALEAAREGWSPARYALWRLRFGLISEEFDRRWAFNRPVWARPESEHAVVRNLRLARALGVSTAGFEGPPPLPDGQRERQAARALLEAAPAGALVALHLGSPRTQYAKLWPPERWGEACRRLVETRGGALVLIGTDEEKEAARRFAGAFNRPFLDLTGRTSLLELLAVLRRCALLLGCDTGPAKLAMALGVATATAWGPTSRRDHGALWDVERHVEITLDTPCSPCVLMGLRAEGAGVINFTNCGHRRCLTELDPGRVIAAAGRVWPASAAK